MLAKDHIIFGLVFVELPRWRTNPTGLGDFKPCLFCHIVIRYVVWVGLCGGTIMVGLWLLNVAWVGCG